jgi:hypothetical protein
MARRFDVQVELDAALEAVAQGNSVVATERLAQLDHRLAALPDSTPEVQVRLRVRGSILAMSEALTQHASYFDADAPR